MCHMKNECFGGKKPDFCGIYPTWHDTLSNFVMIFLVRWFETMEYHLGIHRSEHRLFQEFLNWACAEMTGLLLLVLLSQVQH